MKPERVGVICSLLSAVGYSIANAFLRAVSHCDPGWVCSVKAVWTIVIFGPWLVYLLMKGDRLIVSWRPVAILCVAGTIAQFGGNMMFQWSLDQIGMSFAVPLCLGTLIMTGALLGKVFLKEQLNRNTVVSIGVLVIAIVVLNLGTASNSKSGKEVSVLDASPSVQIDEGAVAAAEQERSSKTWTRFLGGLAASISGASFATLSVTLRYFMRDDVPLATPMVIVGVLGFIGLGAAGYWNSGWEGLLGTSRFDLLIMSLAGVANAAAFLAITKALKLVSVATVNIVNATQVAMGAALGVAIFGEEVTNYLLIGCALTVVGFVIRGKGNTKREKFPRTKSV